MHRTVGAPDPAQHARTLGSRQVLVPPLLQRGEDELEFPAGRRQPVSGPGSRAGLLVGLAFHNPVRDELRQPVRQDVRGDAQPVPELGEPRRSQQGLPQDQEGPPLAKYTQAAGDRATRFRNACHRPIIPLSCSFIPSMLGWKNLLRGVSPMEISGKTALVTGANRGLGRHLAAQLRDRGAFVYAAARNPATVDLPGVTPIALDVTDPASVTAAAAAASGVAILVNNAGSSTGASLLDGSLADIELEMNTHFYGTLLVTRAFAPQLAAGGGGGVLNVLSALSWLNLGAGGAYGAAKAAEWSLTNGLRLQLAAQGTQVTALHVGYMDTDMVRQLDVPKIDPAVVAKLALDGLAAGAVEILADDTSRRVQQGLARGVAALYPQFA